MTEHFEPTEQRSRRWPYVAVLAIGLLVATAVFTRVSAQPVGCGQHDWPAFMAVVTTPRADAAPQLPGWILWCHETHWTLHVTDAIAGETTSMQTRGEARDVFPWFSPALSPEEAWEALASEVLGDQIGSEKPTGRMVAPRSGSAILAYVAKTDAGQLRMEFDGHGIPVRVRVPGDDGWFFDTHLSFSGRELWSDDDVMNWPACSQPGQAGFTNEPQPCWNNAGLTRPAGSCWESLAKVTGLDNTLGCTL